MISKLRWPFYREGLGLTGKIIGNQWKHGAIALFDLEGGMALSLFPRGDLALDAKINKALEAYPSSA